MSLIKIDCHIIYEFLCKHSQLHENRRFRSAWSFKTEFRAKQKDESRIIAFLIIKNKYSIIICL